MLLVLTEYCTKGCPHCISDCTPEGQHASFEVVEGFVNWAKEIGAKKIAISGGEPTQHPNFLEYFSYIISALSEQAVIILISNGYFLKHDDICKGITDLQVQYRFGIQVSSIKGLYRNHELTVSEFKKKKNQFNSIEMVNQLSFIERLGRAAGRNDLSSFATLGQRKAPGCFNVYAAVRQLPDLKTAINFLDNKTCFNFCKPMVSITGDVQAGESIFCPVVGNILCNSNDQIYNRLVNSQPCEKCQVMVPKEFKLMFGWK